MGTWDLKPWGNDSAADYFGVFFERSGFRERAVEQLEMQLTEENHEKVRAAASIILFLGRVYVWPVEFLDNDLKLAIERLTEMLELPIVKEDDEYQEVIRSELELLRSRLDRSRAIDDGCRQYWNTLV